MSTGFTFNADTNYGHTWKYYHGAVEGRLYYQTAGGATDPPYKNCHGLRLDVNRPEWSNAAAALMLTADSTLWHIWPENADDDKPGNDDLWRIAAGDEDAGDWIIRAVTKGRWGAKWLIGTVWASING